MKYVLTNLNNKRYKITIFSGRREKNKSKESYKCLFLNVMYSQQLVYFKLIDGGRKIFRDACSACPIFCGEKKRNSMLALSEFSLPEMGTVLHRLIAGVCLTETGALFVLFDIV